MVNQEIRGGGGGGGEGDTELQHPSIIHYTFVTYNKLILIHIISKPYKIITI